MHGLEAGLGLGDRRHGGMPADSPARLIEGTSDTAHNMETFVQGLS